MIRSLLALAAILTLASTSQAQLFRRVAADPCPNGRCPLPQASARVIVRGPGATATATTELPKPAAVAPARPAPPAVKEAKPLPAVQPATRAVPPAVRFSPPAVTVRIRASVRETLAGQPLRSFGRVVLFKLAGLARF